MIKRYFIDSWLTPCSLRSHRIANSSPKNGLRHFSALPTHHPAGGGQRGADTTDEAKHFKFYEYDRYKL
jgi:hypothetical protein